MGFMPSLSPAAHILPLFMSHIKSTPQGYFSKILGNLVFGLLTIY